MDFTDPKTLKNKVLTIQQGRKRFQVLKNMEQQLDENDGQMTPRSTTEIKSLNKMFESHANKPLKGIVNIPRLSSGSPYYSIKFSEQTVPLAQTIMLCPYPKTEINSWDAIEQACNQDEIRPVIQKIQISFQQIDLSTFSSQLRHVGSLLAITIACSYGQQVSTPIIKLSLNYQSLAHDSYNASRSFVRSSIAALGYHKLAFLCVSKKKYAILQKKMLQIGKLGDEMILECDKLIKSCQGMRQNMTTVIQKIDKELLQKIQQEKQMTQNYKNYKQSQLKSKKLFQQMEKQKIMQKTAFEAKILNFQKRCDDLEEKIKTSFKMQQITANITNFESAADMPSFKPSDMPNFQSTSNKNDRVLSATTVGAVVGSVAGPVGACVGAFVGWCFSSFSKKKQPSADNNNKLKAYKQKLSAQNQAYSKQVQAYNNKVLAQKQAYCKKLQVEITKMEIQGKENVLAHEGKLKLMQQARDLYKQKCQIEDTYIQIQRKIVRQEISSNNDLITTVHRLVSTVKENNQLQTAKICLDIGRNILVKVKTAFQNTKKFWCSIQENCKNVQDKKDDIQTAIDLGEEEQQKLINKIRSSGLDWLTLAKMNRSGALMFQELIKDIDNKMLSLPTQANALKKIEELHDSLPKDLQCDNKNLQLKNRQLLDQKKMVQS